MTGMDHVLGTRLTPVARGAGLVTAFSILFFCAGPLQAQTSAPSPDAPLAATLSQPAAPPSSTPVSPPEAAPVTAGQTVAPAAESSVPAAEAASPSPHVTEAVLPSTLPRDLSPWGMFLSAVLPVKIVMVGLALASLATWTVWLAKTIELWMAKARARRNFEILAHAASLRVAEKELGSETSPIARFVAAAAGEADRSEGLAIEGVKDRTATLLSRIEAYAGRRIMRGTGILATVGATAPFIGLFGTVWGIMDSFIGISKTNTTNLAVVAPGIAEALLATAMGLVAAIPAVVMYNGFARSITSYRAQLGDAAAEVLRHLSRDLDREELPPQKEKAPVVRLHESAE
ncbi:tonB-system energizer ExbB [Methylocapsa sp. D3K7]|uniref:tonB-system energizer ExbB n=1 Tax=Methylocapsa sp. D3K7 TaxID=3041435 RepID=UPI00244ED738|nr:tonB-system energizer ExbB [Methylocapsa sp. D3K7]WGJ16062.1 tonB-system energizer ExbB [Methylocapsa sp. D3K7]